MREILIAGAGQLGSRYLQGFSLVSEPLRLWVFDISDFSLSVAKNRWETCEANTHEVEFISDLNLLPANIDLAIISSTADVRIKLVRSILGVAKVSNFVLEKILAQSITELNELTNLLSECNGVWVNTPMYMWPLYKNLRGHYKSKVIPIRMVVSGFQGMACNAIHYIDYVSRWNKSKPISINIDELNNDWFAAKREGFYEVDGCLKVYMEDGSTLVLVSDRNLTDYKVSISVGNDIWDVRDKESLAVCGTCLLPGSIKLQSELTSELYDGIFNLRSLDLPRLDQSVIQHKILIDSLILHWNKFMPTCTSRLKIT